MASQPNALLSVFTEQREALTRFLVRRLGNPALAEDLVQETWLRATTGSAVVANPQAYLFRVAANLAIDHRRHVAHGIEIPTDEGTATIADPAASPEAVTEHRRELAKLLRAVDALPPRCREVFVLIKFEGAGYADVALRLGISRNTVMAHMFKAMTALERVMRP